MVSLDVLFEDNHILVVVKPVNIPVQQDVSEDLDMLTIIKDYLREKYDKPGNIFVGLVHRLDRPVGGVMVFAKTSKAASRLSESVRLRQLDKIYTLVCIGDPKIGKYSDRLLKDEKTNMVRIDPKGKDSELIVLSKKMLGDLSLCTVKLMTGRSHQIRVQFASRKTPLWGDQRYHSSAKPGQQIALWATELTFPHPISKELITFSCYPPDQFPFNQF
jgi:23S rRNA pseudouridine1911/1915/1917 synthase